MNQAFLRKIDETKYLRFLVPYLIYALIISGLLGHVSCLAYAVFKTRIQTDIIMTTQQAILELPKISQSWTISYKLMLEIWSSGHFRVNVWLFLHFWILGKVSRRSLPVLIWLVLDHLIISWSNLLSMTFFGPKWFSWPQTTLKCTPRKSVSISWFIFDPRWP